VSKRPRNFRSFRGQSDAAIRNTFGVVIHDVRLLQARLDAVARGVEWCITKLGRDQFLDDMTAEAARAAEEAAAAAAAAEAAANPSTEAPNVDTPAEPVDVVNTDQPVTP
jgi:hypothetical protein